MDNSITDHTEFNTNSIDFSDVPELTQEDFKM